LALPVKTAVVLAGGKGSRLKPYTDHCPKPLLPVGPMPVLELILRQLKHHGFKQVYLAVGHKAEQLQAYFGDGQALGLQLHYLFETQPLGTAGPLLNLPPTMPPHFLVMNADLVTELNFGQLYQTHCQQGAWATVCTHPRTLQLEFGVIELNPEQAGAIQAFKEKPTLVHSVCMGIYMLSHQALAYLKTGEPCGIDQLLQRLLSQGHGVQAFNFEGYWMDIGCPSDYEAAQRDFEPLRQRLLPPSVAAKGLAGLRSLASPSVAAVAPQQACL
jgi:NDP-sugar pyrophosphorylase family protein